VRVTHIEVFSEAMPLTRPYTIAFRTIADVRMSFVEVHTDNGLIGLGCASPEPHVTGEMPIAEREDERDTRGTGSA